MKTSKISTMDEGTEIGLSLGGEEGVIEKDKENEEKCRQRYKRWLQSMEMETKVAGDNCITNFLWMDKWMQEQKEIRWRMEIYVGYDYDTIAIDSVE